MKQQPPDPQTLAHIESIVLSAARWHANGNGALARCRRAGCRRSGRCAATRMHADPARSPCGRPWQKGELAQIMSMTGFALTREMTARLAPDTRLKRELDRLFGRQVP